MSAPLRLVVADDSPVVRAGLAALLSTRAGFTVVGQAANGHEALDAARLHSPDVILLDLRMPVLDGLAALPDLTRISPVLVLSYNGEWAAVREAVRRGAAGYLVHGEFTADELTTAIRDIHAGRQAFTYTAVQSLAQAVQAGEKTSWPRSGFELSRREAEIMELIASGMSNQQIAAVCFISQKTVKNHVNRIFAKLRSSSRGEAIAKWAARGPGSWRES